MTSQELTVADVPVRALRVTFVGELGWELYAPSEYGAAAVVGRCGRRARDFGLVAGGYRAIESMRLEKGYRVWGTDITPETTPYEAGLGFCVKLDKPGGFEGREALVAAKERGLHAPAVRDRARRPARGRARQRAGAGRTAGSAAGSPRAATATPSGASIAYAYLAIGDAEPGTPVTSTCSATLARGHRSSPEPVLDGKRSEGRRCHDRPPPRIGLTTYREPAACGVWDEPADLLPATYADASPRRRRADAAAAGRPCRRRSRPRPTRCSTGCTAWC